MLESRAMRDQRQDSTLAEMASESLALFKESAGQAAGVLAAGLVPGTVIAAAAFIATGILSREALNQAIADGEWLRAAPLLAAGLIKRLLSTLAFVALVFAVEARHAGRPLSTRESYEVAL